MAHILLAEDDEGVRLFVARALRHRNHSVIETKDGLEALERLDAADGGFDLLLTDIVMPGLDGIALALKAGRDYPHLPVLMMTGYSAECQRAYNLDALIREVITKPFTLKEICKAVENALPPPPRSQGAM